jgi:hypothetical protein
MALFYHDIEPAGWRVRCDGCPWLLRPDTDGPLADSRETAVAAAREEGWHVGATGTAHERRAYCPHCATEDVQAAIRERVSVTGARHLKGD